jgi:hypothetical protein
MIKERVIDVDKKSIVHRQTVTFGETLLKKIKKEIKLKYSGVSFTAGIRMFLENYFNMIERMKK